MWNPYTKRNIHQIELVQHRPARFVFRDYSNFTQVTPMLKQLGWDTLEQCRLSYQLSMFYKIQQGVVGISLRSEVCPLTRASRAPNAFPFRHIQTNCNVCKCWFYPSSIVAWNELPVLMDTFPLTNDLMSTISSIGYYIILNYYYYCIDNFCIVTNNFKCTDRNLSENLKYK